MDEDEARQLDAFAELGQTEAGRAVLKWVEDSVLRSVLRFSGAPDASAALYNEGRRSVAAEIISRVAFAKEQRRQAATEGLSRILED